MKKILLSLLAVAMMFTACQEDALQVAGVTDEVSVSLSASAPEIIQRSSDATSSKKGGLTNVDWSKYDLRYILEIYNADGSKLVKKREVKTYPDGGDANFQIRLTPDRAYRFVVWADFVEEGKTTDLHYNTGTESFLSNNGIQIIQDNYSINDESRDAYFVSQTQEISINSVVNLTLTRPFAKLRIVATDIDELEIGTFPSKISVTYDNANVAAFSPISGNLLDTEMEQTAFEATLVENGIYKADEDAETGVQTLFVDYIFAGIEQSPIQFEFSAYDNSNAVINTYAFETDIPLQRNYLTTIKGNILTTGTDVNISVEEAFKNYYENADALAAAFAQGGTFTMLSALTLSAGTSLEVPTGVTLTLDLNGYTLTNPVAGAGALINNGTLIITNGSVINGSQTRGSHTIVNNGGTLELTDVTAGNGIGAGRAISSIGGKVTINGGELIGSNNTINYPSYFGYVIDADNGCEMIINDSQINTTAENIPNGIFSCQNGSTITINGGTYTKAASQVYSAYMIYMKGSNNTINLNSGTFTWYPSEEIYNKDAVYIVSDGSYTGGNIVESPTNTINIAPKVVRQGHANWTEYATTITLTWAEFLEANSLDMGYGGNNSNITIDGENKYIISDWVDAWYTGNLTVKNITFNQGATFTTGDTNEGTVLIENSTFYACDQDLLVAAGESVYGRIDNSGDGLCLDIETGDKTIVKVLNNKFIGENDATVDRNGYKNWSSVTSGSKDKARGHAICINGIAGQGNATSVLIEGNTITGVRGNSIQLYTFNYPITVTGNTINSWGINKQTAAGEKSDAAIRGDIKAEADTSLLTVTNNYFGLDEITENILHVNVKYSTANTDGTRVAGTY